MKLLITMNMPSNSGKMVHQIIAEHPSETLEAFCNELSDNEMVIVKQLYNNSGTWSDRGDMIINSMHVGKVQAYVDPRNNREWE